jgi:hypothetical protein
MKQTAVEFIIEQLDCLNIERKENLIDAESYFKYKKALTEQAKEMEKQQIIDAHLDGQSLVSCKDEYAEQYYNETFKNK